MTACRFLAAALATAAILLSSTPAAAAPPQTSITSGPSGLIASRSATFRFSANVKRATFQCKLDAKSWSPCESPKKYSRLGQGPHKFRVRARKGSAVDPSPAVRTFTVDTVKPNTTILSGPTGVTEDHSPSFTFSATEPGSFECRLGTPGFTPCASPFVPSSPLPDESYTFEVRARDAAGNADKTPASRAFSVETPLTYSPETAQAAAALYSPDSIDLDVPASCGGNPSIDCPGGNPLAPADQLRVTSTRSLVEVVGQSRYDVTVTSDVQMLQGQVIKVTVSGLDCDLTINSANGATPDWTVDIPLNFVQDVNTGELRIDPGGVTVNGVEAADWSLSGGFACSGLNLPPGTVGDVYRATLVAHFAIVGDPMCAAPGPAYLGPCPAP